jgi:thermostable 8-oxoguanine DNA glycosylase
MKHKTIFDIEIKLNEIKYAYQKELTLKLDKLTGDFNQFTINEIILWKVNRYALIDDETLADLNKISKTESEINLELTQKILQKLLKIKGIRLPIASTILRYKNPNIYQIIDQRVYRLINNDELKLPPSIDKQIILYLNYLTQLRDICENKKIPFREADRILYEIDKIKNKGKKLRNY